MAGVALAASISHAARHCSLTWRSCCTRRDGSAVGSATSHGGLYRTVVTFSALHSGLPNEASAPATLIGTGCFWSLPLPSHRLIAPSWMPSVAGDRVTFAAAPDA